MKVTQMKYVCTFIHRYILHICTYYIRLHIYFHIHRYVHFTYIHTYICIFCDAIEKTSKAKQLCRFRVSAFFFSFRLLVGFVFVIITTSLTPLKLFLMGSLMLTRALSLSLFLSFFFARRRRCCCRCQCQTPTQLVSL